MLENKQRIVLFFLGFFTGIFVFLYVCFVLYAFIYYFFLLMIYFIILFSFKKTPWSNTKDIKLLYYLTFYFVLFYF